jgi:hypothetical protein
MVRSGSFATGGLPLGRREVRFGPKTDPISDAPGHPGQSGHGSARPYITESRPTSHPRGNRLAIFTGIHAETFPLGASTGVITESCLPNTIKS